MPSITKLELVRVAQLLRTTVLAVLLMLVAGIPRSAEGSTLCVDKTGTPGCYVTVQEAINAAAAGDTVLVRPWPGYDESVSITKPVVVLGAGFETTAITYSGPTPAPALTFSGSCYGAKVAGLRITSAVGSGVRVRANGVTVSNCLLAYSKDYGFWCYDNSINTITVRNCVIAANGSDGVNTGGNSNYPGFYNCIVYKNLGYGITRDWNAAMTQYCCVDSNGAGNFHGLPAGTGDLNGIVPMFVAFDQDLHLASGSPCIDAGTLGPAFSDCDGTRNDIGIYGGSDAVCGPGPVVTHLQLVPPTVSKGGTFKIQATGAAR